MLGPIDSEIEEISNSLISSPQIISAYLIDMANNY